VPPCSFGVFYRFTEAADSFRMLPYTANIKIHVITKN